MSVLAFHIGGKLPLLALMRLHAFHRVQGDRVELRQTTDDQGYCVPAEIQPRLDDPTWDRVYDSVIFERTKPEHHTKRGSR